MGKGPLSSACAAVAASAAGGSRLSERRVHADERQLGGEIGGTQVATQSAASPASWAARPALLTASDGIRILTIVADIPEVAEAIQQVETADEQGTKAAT
jgi:hypothetical protein